MLPALRSPSTSPRHSPLISADGAGCAPSSKFFSVIAWNLSIFLHSELLCSFFYEHTAFRWVDLSLKSPTDGHLVHFPF